MDGKTEQKNKTNLRSTLAWVTKKKSAGTMKDVVSTFDRPPALIKAEKIIQSEIRQECRTLVFEGLKT